MTIIITIPDNDPTGLDRTKFIVLFTATHTYDAVDNNPNNSGIKANIAMDGMWTVSDQTKKEDIQNPGIAPDKITGLNKYGQQSREIDRGLKQREVVGIMAQDLKDVNPQAVDMNPSGDYFINSNQVTLVLIGAIKELKDENDLLKDRLEEPGEMVRALPKE